MYVRLASVKKNEFPRGIFNLTKSVKVDSATRLKHVGPERWRPCWQTFVSRRGSSKRQVRQAIIGVLDAFLDFVLGGNADRNAKCRESLNDDLDRPHAPVQGVSTACLGFALDDGLRTAVAIRIDRGVEYPRRQGS